MLEIGGRLIVKLAWSKHLFTPRTLYGYIRTRFWRLWQLKPPLPTMFLCFVLYFAAFRLIRRHSASRLIFARTWPETIWRRHCVCRPPPSGVHWLLKRTVCTHTPVPSHQTSSTSCFHRDHATSGELSCNQNLSNKRRLSHGSTHRLEPNISEPKWLTGMKELDSDKRPDARWCLRGTVLHCQEEEECSRYVRIGRS